VLDVAADAAPGRAGSRLSGARLWAAVGQTALVLLVEAADPLVAGWRARYDPAAAQGMPAHLTLLYPFLPESGITAVELATLDQVVGAHPAFDVTFAELGRFPGSLWLAPVPDSPVRDLIAAVCATWPHVPPYGGLHAVADVVPHVTVATAPPKGWDEVSEHIAAELRAGLPFVARIEAAHLFAFDGRAWVVRHRSPLGGSTR
jgi:2'-5' RNA ligase